MTHEECLACTSWDFIRYHYNPECKENEEAEALIVDELISVETEESFTPCEMMSFITNWVNENIPNASDYLWCNTTGDDWDWEYAEGGMEETFSGRPVYGLFPTAERFWEE